MPGSFNLSKNWKEEKPRKRFSTPYSPRELIQFLLNNLFGPSKKYQSLTSFLPKEVILNPISPEITLGFIGDILPTEKRTLRISRTLRKFLGDCDYLIGNFEGTITSRTKEVLMAQSHSKKILEDLAKIFPPEKTVLSCSNNHSGDFGWEVFNRSYQLLKKNGFLVLGRRDEPTILLEDKINLAAITTWTNQNCSYLSTIKELSGYFQGDALLNILFPHWGYELYCYPHPKQIVCGKALLKKWDMIVGHHSHCPQPVASYCSHAHPTIVAYSLGDFCFSSKLLKKYHYGIILKTQLGPLESNEWAIGKIEWQFIFTKITKNEKIEVQLVSTCPCFD